MLWNVYVLYPIEFKDISYVISCLPQSTMAHHDPPLDMTENRKIITHNIAEIYFEIGPSYKTYYWTKKFLNTLKPIYFRFGESEAYLTSEVT